MMPQIEIWSRLPAAIRVHLVERMHDRKISLEDLNRLRVWVESKQDVPTGPWYKDFWLFQALWLRAYPKTFLLTGQAAEGQKL